MVRTAFVAAGGSDVRKAGPTKDTVSHWSSSLILDVEICSPFILADSKVEADLSVGFATLQPSHRLRPLG